jgi:hypothetical protein
MSFADQRRFIRFFLALHPFHCREGSVGTAFAFFLALGLWLWSPAQLQNRVDNLPGHPVMQVIPKR